MLACLCTSESARVLLLPPNAPSHARQQMIIGEGLIEKGHEVYMVLSDSFPQLDMYSQGKATIIVHRTFKEDLYQGPKDVMDRFVQGMQEKRDTVATWRENNPRVINMCSNPLSDDQLFQRLNALKFDLAIVDLFGMSRCLVIIPYRLGIPYIALTTSQEPWLMRNPGLPSCVPNNMAGHAYDDHMQFWERLDNLWMQVDWVAFPQFTSLDDGFLAQFFKDKPAVSLDQLAGQSLFWFIDNDIAIDYPRPLMPNEVYIGGLTTQAPKTLPEDMKQFLDGATHGAILMTFGSVSFQMLPRDLEEFVKAFQKIKMRVIWKYVTVPEGLLDNVKVSKWLPQNDILGHQNVRLFITHSGANGQFEALFHGVPTIGFPIFGDQHYNCKRASVKNIGACLELKSFTAEELLATIHEITSNASYSASAEQRSQIYRDRAMTARQRAVYWVEHALKYGGSHVHAHALDMPWYEYLMLDIFCFIGTCFLLGILTIFCGLRFLLSALKKMSGFQKTKEE